MKTEYGVAVAAGAVVVVGAAWYFFGQNDQTPLRMSTGPSGEPSASTGGEPTPEPQAPLPLRVAQAPASPEPGRTTPNPSPETAPPAAPAAAVPNRPTVNAEASTTPEAAGPRRSALANRRIALTPPTAPASVGISLPAVSDQVATPSPAVATADPAATGPRTLLGSRTRNTATPTAPASPARPESSRAAGKPPVRRATSRPAGGTQYVIQAGDRLAILAELHYGDQSFIDVLLAANPQIKDANRIFAGTKIVIPPKPASARGLRRSAVRAGRPAPPAAPTRRAVAAGMYRVKRGDILSALARKHYGSAAKWRALLRLNRDLIEGDGSRLIHGQIIRLPTQLPNDRARASRPGG